MKEKIKYILKTALQFLLNPRLLLCLGLAWMITNGWSYIVFAIGTTLEIQWMIAVGSSYMALLWIPATPEKLITCAIAIFLLKVFFPNDKKTLGVLKQMRLSAVSKWKNRKRKKKES